MASTITQFNHLRIPLEEVLKATNDFDDKNVVGHGDLGKVYRGRLWQSGKWVKIAARRLDPKHKRGIEFWTEISALSSFKHDNIVSIMGFCDEKDEKVIINKRVAKGSLAMYLSNPTLTWTQRLTICVGVARALRYIHNEDGHSYPVIHRNINSSTILLDNKFEAKLSGFEYSINYPVHRMDQVLFSEAIGTTGYMDPAIEKTGGVTHKSDIYSFGIVLWEILCGRKALIPNDDNRFLAPLAIFHYENKTLNDIIQPGLLNQIDGESLDSFSKVAYQCLKDERVQRPDMNYIVHELEKLLERQLQYVKFLLQFSHLQIPLEDIIEATNNFDDKNFIGDTPFGKDYEGELLRSGKWVNITARRSDNTNEKGYIRFRREIYVLSSIKHQNIVSIIGFCDEKNERVVINNRYSNGSLSWYLSEPTLTWVQRLRICVSVARALSYIHNDDGRGYSIIHQYINSGAILLDENFEAKLSYFEYSFTKSVHQMDQAPDPESVTLIGYEDPTRYSDRGVTDKSDIYSFGVVLWEILCGREAYLPNQDDSFLAPLARFHFENKTLNDIILPNLRNQIAPESLNWFSIAAYSCIKENRKERPDINNITRELERALECQISYDNLDDQVQRQDIDRVVDSLEMNLTHENWLLQFSHLQIPLEDIVEATNNFDDKNVIGGGEFGKDYRGELLRSGKWVKIAARRSDNKNEEDYIKFRREIYVLSSIEHQNIVSIIGFCDEKNERVVINNRYSNGSLSLSLSKPSLTWIQRLRICLGVARALSYIHNDDGRGYYIIHQYINSTTILLDENFEAKLSFFEYSFTKSVHQMNQAPDPESVAFIGYVDPERKYNSDVTHKSDIYSFGVVLWEILCGRRAYLPNEDDSFLAPLARFHYENKTLNDIILPSLRNQIAPESLKWFSIAAYSCIKENRRERPDMNNIIRKLERALECQISYDNLEQSNNAVESISWNNRKGLEHLTIPLSDIKLATDNFSLKYRTTSPTYYELYIVELEHFDKVNFASVEYKNNSELLKRRSTVCVKRLQHREDKYGEELFFTELEMLTTCEHHNIVTLLGICAEGLERILVIEHLSNGYLDTYLVDIKNRRILTWEARLKICVDIAYGLNYLHYEMENQKMIIHREIGSYAIALDENWGAKIVDFGHSVLLPLNQDDDGPLHLNFFGNYCYCDPEYDTTKKLKRASDVFSFGVFLFEIFCGRRAYDPNYIKENEDGLAYVARRCFQEGTLKEMVDPIIKEESGGENFTLNRGPNKESVNAFLDMHVSV